MDNDFDSYDYQSLNEISPTDIANDPFVMSNAMVHSSHAMTVDDCLLKHDPLAHIQHLNLEPVKLTYVEPHWVDGYLRSDGTYVQGYFRDGDGNTNVFDGDGYYRRS